MNFEFGVSPIFNPGNYNIKFANKIQILIGLQFKIEKNPNFLFKYNGFIKGSS